MKRDSYFDNYKGLLIILVVISHFVGAFTGKSHLFTFIVIAIYSFHMPAFVFVSAYFSKNNSLLKLVKTLLIPYVFFQIIYFILAKYMWGREEQFQILSPYFTLWFLLSLFCWRFLIDKIIRIKGILPISFILGILVGFDTTIGGFGSLGKTMRFLPFFILGYTFNKEKFMNFINKRTIKTGSYLLLISIFLSLFFSCDYISIHVLTMKNSYTKVDLLKWGWLYQTFVYIISTLLIYLIATAIPKNRHWYTFLGQRTMSIYLLHGIIYKIIRYQTHLYDNIDTEAGRILVLLFAVFLSFILSLKPFDCLIKRLSTIPIEKLLIRNKYMLHNYKRSNRNDS